MGNVTQRTRGTAYYAGGWSKQTSPRPRPEIANTEPETVVELHSEAGRLAGNAESETVRLKSALKKKGIAVSDRELEMKRVQFNLADLEIRDAEESMPPPFPGYGIKYLETVWPGEGPSLSSSGTESSGSPNSRSFGSDS